MSVLISTRGPKTGTCNICGVHGKLTEDHTPPKGCIRIGQVEMHHVVEHLAAERSAVKGRLSQNGVKYRTLCAECNNRFLGTEYDPVFIDFVNTIGQVLRSRLELPNPIRINTKPQRVMRSLLGHLAAQGVDRYKKGGITEPLRDYFLNPAEPLPSSLNIYCWPFPFNDHIMARDCSITDLKVGKPVAIWFLKFFPIAFLVTINEPPGYTFHATELSTWRSLEIDGECEIPLEIKSIQHQRWPEAPTKTSIIMYGQEAIVSFNRETLSR